MVARSVCQDVIHGTSSQPSAGIFAPGCRENNVVSSKIGALVILRGLLNLDIDLTSIPTQLEESDGFDTIIDADYVRPIGNVTVEVG